MILPPKTLFWRLLLWSGLLIWAVWKMRQTSEPVVPADVPEETPAPVANVDTLWTAPVDSPADPKALPVVDVAAAMAAMDATESAAKPCSAVGTLTVELGPSGLQSATLEGSGDRACLTAVVHAQKWPSTLQAFELERQLSR